LLYKDRRAAQLNAAAGCRLTRRHRRSLHRSSAMRQPSAATSTASARQAPGTRRKPTAKRKSSKRRNGAPTRREFRPARSAVRAAPWSPHSPSGCSVVSPWSPHSPLGCSVVSHSPLGCSVVSPFSSGLLRGLPILLWAAPGLPILLHTLAMLCLYSLHRLCHPPQSRVYIVKTPAGQAGPFCSCISQCS
jgi:hypothetical protein